MRSHLFTTGAVAVVVAVTSCGGSSGNPASPSPNASTIRVVAENGAQSFTPNPAQGSQSVVFRNDHNDTHRMVANDGSFDTGDLAAGAVSGAVQPPAGGVNYHCSIHPAMVGAIGATGGGPPPPCTDGYC
jgi:plastocyanin